MGEQAVTGAGATPAPEQRPDAGGGASAGTTAGMAADGAPTAPADVSGAGMAADTAPAAPAGGAGAGPQQRSTDITTGPGGVMTDEVGVVTGELTLRTEYADGQVTLRVQYKDADEWYVVTGGKVALADPAGLDAVHTIAVALLNRPEG